jgi:polysaccharide export outer membrane protein
MFSNVSGRVPQPFRPAIRAGMRLALAAVVSLTPPVADAAVQTLPAQPAPAGSTDYRVGPQDVLAITVFNENDLSGAFTIDSDGTLSYPLLGRIKVEGESLRQIQEKLTKLLGESFLVNPQLSVEIKEYRSQSVYVLGEVRSPGIIRLAGNMTLIEVLIQAGSVTSAAGNELQIVRPKGGRKIGGPVLATDNVDVEVTYVDLRDIQSGRLSQVVLRDGDTVFVPKAATFFADGEVRAPGSYTWQRSLNVQQAIVLAGGLTDRGSRGRIKILRQVDGKRVEVDVNDSDLVQPGDTIVVGRRFF